MYELEKLHAKLIDCVRVEVGMHWIKEMFEYGCHCLHGHEFMEWVCYYIDKDTSVNVWRVIRN